MPLRTKLQILLTLLTGAVTLGWAWQLGTRPWLPFALLSIGVLASSGLKLELVGSDGSISLNFPFVLLGLLELRPFEGMLLAALSVAAVMRIRTVTPFSVLQIAFNIASALIATACAYGCYFGLHGIGLASAPALALASVVYFLANTGSVAAVIASSERRSLVSLWRAQFLWFLPFYLVGAVLAATAHWLQTSYGWANELLLLPVTYTLYRAYAAQVSRLKERQQHIEETEALQLRTIEGLAMAIEAKDQNTHDHLFRVRTYVHAIGEALELDKLEMQALQTAAFLHDIGKLAVPEAIINKPGKLTPEEFEKMKIHPVVGADILERVRFPYPVVPIVRSHHEWWNGTGYPDGLKGEDIPIGARILTVVDCYDALVSDRPYRKGMLQQQALAILRSMSGKQFDPRVVSLFEQYHAARAAEEGANAVGSPFTPLNTDVEVSRGQAPGAGFEAGSDHRDVSVKGIPIDAQQNTAVLEPSTLAAIARARQQTAQVLEVARSAGAALAPEEVFSLLTLRLQTLVPHDLCIMFLREKDALQPRFTEGPQARAVQPEVIPMGAGISGWVAQMKRPLLNGNAAVEPGCPVAPNGDPLLRSTLSVPFLDPQGQVAGVVTLYSAQPEAFSREQVRILQTIADQLEDAPENEFSPSLGDSLGLQDAPTGLPDAHGLMLHLESELKQAAETRSSIVLAVISVDGWAEMVRQRGQLTADRLVKQLAESLRQLCSGREYLARVSGDKFAFVLARGASDLAGERVASLTLAAETLTRRLGQGLRLHCTSASAVFPADGATSEQLLACAERRLRSSHSAVPSTPAPVTSADAAKVLTCAE